MSRLHTLKDGYWTKTGKNKAAVMLTMSPEERLKLYSYCCDVEKIKQLLQYDNLLTDWNDHDEKVIPGVATNVGPHHRGGRNKDITEAQLIKFCRALLKIKGGLSKMQKELPWCPVLDPTNTDDDEPILSAQEVKRQMDINRAADSEQNYLKENPDLIKDQLENFKSVWPKYSNK